MRILFLTNFYQVNAGGEEQSCQQVVEGLTQRGHTTLVLTSMHGTNNVPVEAGGIHQALYLEMDLVPLRHSITFFTKRKAREKHNLQVFENVLQDFDPDIIFIWGMWNLHNSLPALAEARYPHKVVYRFATYWPTLPSQHEVYWRIPGRNWYSRFPKWVLGQFALAMLGAEVRQHPLIYEHAICVSATTRDILVKAGIPISNARIIYTGLDEKKYLNSEPSPSQQGNQGIRLLYAGRLASDKGIDTAIRAMAKLVHGQGLAGMRMSLAGSGPTDYETYLRHLVSQADLTEQVTFLGWIPPNEIPELMRKFDVLVLPSIWPEPFSRAVLEGMLSNLVVVATRTGGTVEILTDGENGLLFAPGDVDDLAQKITCLTDDAGLRRKLASAGHRTVVGRYTLTKMVDEFESYLQEIAIASSEIQAV